MYKAPKERGNKAFCKYPNERTNERRVRRLKCTGCFDNKDPMMVMVRRESVVGDKYRIQGITETRDWKEPASGDAKMEVEIGKEVDADERGVSTS